VGTLAALKDRCRTILASLVVEHEGGIVNVMGDGVVRSSVARLTVVSAGE
jgi:hypothetical protein